jgi:23S rRNA pseudouridine1911/1915/1917 synthase
LKKKIQYKLNIESRLDKYLNDQFPDISRSKIQKSIQLGNVTVNGLSVKCSFKLKNNEFIEFDLVDTNQQLSDLTPQNLNLDILYEDNDIIIINKKSGIVVHPGVGNYDKTLLNGLLYHCSKLSNISNRPGVIHRLDKETSGVIVFAKTDQAHHFISEQFANREIEKFYKAICWGNLLKKRIIKTNLMRDPRNRLRFKISDFKGKVSSSALNPITNYTIPVTEVDIYPKTGRTHQIRVHLSSIKHPILNDFLYDGGEDVIDSFHQNFRKDIKKVLKCISRIALHAYKIKFIHPVSKEKVSFVAPLPDDFKRTLKVLDEFK